MANDALFFVGQKAFIENDEGKLLVLFTPRGRVDLPGGKIQEGEFDYRESLVREVREETGLEVAVGDPFMVWGLVLPDFHPDAGRTVFLVGYRCSFAGGEPAISDEHARYAWIGEEDLGVVSHEGAHFGALEEYFRKRKPGLSR